MNCQNCGAPMTLYRERDYFFCEHCGSYFFPDASEEGVRLLDEAGEGFSCPVCQTRLMRAEVGIYRGYSCPKCRGLLLDRWSFGEVVKFRRSRAHEEPIIPALLDQQELKRRLDCPRCSEQMETHPYYGPGNIVVQTCRPCNLIWLDYGELGRVVAAPGRDRGSYNPQATVGEQRMDESQAGKEGIRLFGFKIRFF